MIWRAPRNFYSMRQRRRWSAELEAAQEELKRLKEEAKNILRLKVSGKGAVSIYGMRRVPITLYAGEIKRIVSELIDTGRLNAFIEENEGELANR